jgi:multiple sugar transport system permease protein
MTVVTEEAKAKRPRNSSSRSWTRLLPYLFIGPAMLYIAVFVMIPLGRGVQLSFTDTKLINPQGGEWLA